MEVSETVRSAAVCSWFGFVSGGVLVAEEGAPGVAPVRSFEKLPALQGGPASGPGQVNHRLWDNLKGEKPVG